MGHREGPVDLLVELERGRRGAAARAARAHAARRRSAPGRLPAGTRLPSSRGAGRGARDLPRRRYLGLRAARRRGVSRDQAGGACPRRARGRAPSSARRPRRRCCRGSPTTSVPGCPTWPASRATAGCARCAAPGATRRSTRSATAIRAVSPELREALADYLGRVRGVAADAEQLADLHRLSPGAVAHLPVAARPGHRARSRWRIRAGTPSG